MSKYLYSLTVAILFASCTLFNGHQNAATTPSRDDIAQFQKSFMSSYFSERTGAPVGVARALTPFSVAASSSGTKATVPVDRLTTVSFGSLAPLSFANYPEPGQTTTFSATMYDVSSKVYDIKVTTNYPSSDVRKTYFEEYYVQDSLDAGNWTINDPIVKYSGSWVQDQAARVKMLLTFRDGSARNETIVSSSLAGGPLFSPSAFDIAGSLDLSQAFLPAAVAAGGNVMFSSVVLYTLTPSTSYNFWFWKGNSANAIVGVRYYTEYADVSANRYIGYTASFEKAVETLSTSGGSYASAMQTVFVGSQSTVLAESVLRQKAGFALAGTAPTGDYWRASGSALDLTTNMKSRVVNIAGLKDFYLSQLNSDYVQLSSLASSTIYIPTGDATEILANDATALAFGRTTSSTAVAGGQSLAVTVVDPLLGTEISKLYHSIQLGADSSAISNAPASNVMPANTAWTFNGYQVEGTLINPTPGPLTTSGAVEAWVYINQMTDTMGIVHKGTNANFSDEAFSLQGWGSGGQIAMLVDRSGSYDAAYSDINLNTGKWYYLVGTWDVTGGNRYLRLYINGVLHGSGTPSAINPLGTTDATSTGLMVGSQLPVSYNSTWGYFGVNGKIVGVNLSATPMSAAAALANYNAYKDYAISW
jgi:hypothetical protein